MLDSPILLRLATRLPRLFRGATLHRWGLEAMHAGEHDLADRLFEAGGIRYRAEIMVEPLARLRVHQRMARVRSGKSPAHEAEWVIEIESMLTRLGRIEALEPPFALVEAHTLLANWLDPSRDETAADSGAAHRTA